MEYQLAFFKEREEGYKAGKLLGLKCKDCGKVTFPPRKVCADCGSENQEIVEMSGKGEIVTLTTCMAVPIGFQGPFVVAMVSMEEGGRVMADINVPDPTKAGLELIGKKVQSTVKEIPGDFMTGGDTRWAFVGTPV
jgi:uncharacterized OB-fold protein